MTASASIMGRDRAARRVTLTIDRSGALKSDLPGDIWFVPDFAQVDTSANGRGVIWVHLHGYRQFPAAGADKRARMSTRQRVGRVFDLTAVKGRLPDAVEAVREAVKADWVTK